MRGQGQPRASDCLGEFARSGGNARCPVPFDTMSKVFFRGLYMDRKALWRAALLLAAS